MTWEGAGMTWESVGMTWEGVGMTRPDGMTERPTFCGPVAIYGAKVNGKAPWVAFELSGRGYLGSQGIGRIGWSYHP